MFYINKTFYNLHVKLTDYIISIYRLEGEGEFTDTDGQVWMGTFRYRAAPGLRFKLNLD